MEITTDFRKRMIIKLVEVLKKTQRFANIQFSLLKNIILNSEQQIFQKSKNKHEYEITINKKIDYIKLSEYQFTNILNHNKCNDTISEVHTNIKFNVPPLDSIPYNIFYNNQIYHTAVDTKYSHPLIMNRKTTCNLDNNQSNETYYQSMVINTNNDFNSNSKTPDKFLNNSTVLSDFENIFNKKHKKSINNSQEINNYKFNCKIPNMYSIQNDINNTNILQNEIPNHVKFTISVGKKKIPFDNNTKKYQNNYTYFSKHNTISNLESEKIKFNLNNSNKDTITDLSKNINIVDLQTFIDNTITEKNTIENCAEWHDTLDFILSLGNIEKKYLIQNKYRDTKFISIKDMEEKINWYVNQIDHFIEDIINGFEKRKEAKEDFCIVIK